MNKSLLFALAVAMGLNSPALAQVSPPPPTPEQLARAAQEDQLSDQKCGIPRNAADEYRPAPMYPDQTRAHRVVSTQKFKVDSIASGLQNAWGLAFLPSGNMLVTIRGSGLKTVTPDGKVSELLTGTPAIKNGDPPVRHARRDPRSRLREEPHDLSRLCHAGRGWRAKYGLRRQRQAGGRREERHRLQDPEAGRDDRRVASSR